MFLGGGKKSLGVGRLGNGLGGLSEGGDEYEDEDEDRPDENDMTFDAKEKRYRLFEASVKELVHQVEFHHGRILAAFNEDSEFAKESVRLAGVTDPELRKSAALAWSGSAAAQSIAAAYASEVGVVLLAKLKADLMTFEKVESAIKERAKVDKEFSHYVGKLAELRIKQEKAPDPKKLARNQQKYDEAMLSLEMHTQTCVDMFTTAEKRREELVTKDFVAWQKAQHTYIPKLVSAFKDGRTDGTGEADNGAGSGGKGGMSRRSFLAVSCPIEGLDKRILAVSKEDGSPSSASASSSKKDAASSGSVSVLGAKSSWRTNIKHRLKYGAAADFAATDEEMEKSFTDEASYYAEFEKTIPQARKKAEAFVTNADEAFRSRVDIDETFLRVCGLPRGGDDTSRMLTDFERFSSYDSEQLTVGQVEAEVEVRLDSDIDAEDLLEATVLRFQGDVLGPLEEAIQLFKQPTVLDMMRERPKLVASVNHYKTKMKDLEKACEEAKKKGKEKDAKKKLEGNQAKHDAEVEKLQHLTTQLVHSFGLIEQQCTDTMGAVTLKGFECKCDLATHLGTAAQDITTHEMVSGGGESSRTSVGGGRRTRKRGVSSALKMKPKPYDPSAPSRKELLRKGLGANGLPLKLSDLRYEQAVTLQCSLRRLQAAKRYRRMKAAAVVIQARRRCFSAFRWFYYSRQWITKHQSLTRGVAVRERVKAMINAAVLIQRAYGGFKIKAKFKNSLEQVTRIQSVVRGGLVRAKIRKWNASALTLQRVLARGAHGRAVAVQHAFLVVRVQAAARRWGARQRLKHIHSSAAGVQAHARRKQATKRYAQDRRRVVLVQSLGRRKVAAAYVDTLHAGASAMQAVYFGLKARRQLQHAKNAAAKVQALARGVLVRHGVAMHYVQVRHFKLVWPDASLPQAGVGAQSRRDRRGSMGDLFSGAERRMSASLNDNDRTSEGLLSNPMAAARGGLEQAAAVGVKAAAGLMKGSSGAGETAQSSVTKKAISMRVHEQLMLFDNKLLTIISTKNFLRMVSGRRRMFILHKAASLIQAVARTKKEMKLFAELRRSAVMFQSVMRAGIALRRVRMKKKAAVVVQRWIRKRREQGDQWKAMLAKARETAEKAREEKSSVQTVSAKRIQKVWTRRRDMKLFAHAVADYLVKREKLRLESKMSRSEREQTSAVKVQALVRGALFVRNSTDESYFPQSRKARSYRGLREMAQKLRQAKEQGEEEADVLSEAAEAAMAVASGVRGMAASMLSQATAPKKQPAPRKSRMAKKEERKVPPPRLNEQKGRFQHFRSAAVVIQTFCRRVVVLHKLYSCGTVSTTFTWRAPHKAATSSSGGGGGRKRLGAHKLPWYRGHKGVVTVRGAALRTIGLLGFCKLVILRRKLYEAECSAVCIQAAWRRTAQQRRYRETLNKLVKVQALSRGRRASYTVRRYKQVTLGFEALAKARRNRRAYRGMMLASSRLLALAKTAKATVAERRRLKAAAVLQRCGRRMSGKKELEAAVSKVRKARAALTKIQARVRGKKLSKQWKKMRKSGKLIAKALVTRHRAWRLRQSILQVVRLAAKGGGGGGKEILAAYRLQKWWKDRVKGGGLVSTKTHKRVLKAGLRFKKTVAELKEHAERQTMEVKELQLELRVTRKHSEETSRLNSERTEKLFEQMQQMQMNSSAASVGGDALEQLKGLMSEMSKAAESGGGAGGAGMGGDDMKRLYTRIERQEDDLSECRTKINSLEAQRDDYSTQLKKTNRQNKSLGDELFQLKKRYMEQRGINAKLMLEVQGLKGNIQVCCRIRPFNAKETERGDEPAVELITETEVGVIGSSTDWETYGFDQVWGAQSSQAQIFEQVEALALSVVDGYNACICCYGQTGSGKTFTMTGLPREGKPGISFQTMDKVFEMLELKRKAAATNLEAMERQEQAEAERRAKLAQRGGDLSAAERRPPPPGGSASKITSFEWSAQVSMLEIYNEEVRCLLSPPPTKKSEAAKKLDVKQGKDGLMTVPGLVAQPVCDTPGVLDAFEQGNSTRSVSATAMNATSSRSHMVLMVDVTTRTNGGAEVTGRLYLVDLAGSERVAKSGVTGQAMKEAQGINKSLSALGDVMEALDKGQAHIPFRNSKLTFLLQSALGGSARCMFIFNASPAEGNSDETRCTFKFASRMRNISLGAAKKNVDASGLEEALAKAKAEARQANAEMGALKSQVEGMRGSGGKASAEMSRKIEDLEGKVALAEQESAAAADEIAALRDKLAAAESTVRDLKSSSSSSSASAVAPPRRRASDRSQSPSTAAEGKSSGGEEKKRLDKAPTSVRPRVTSGRGDGSSGGRGSAASRLSRASTGTTGTSASKMSSRSPPPRSSTGTSREMTAAAKPLRRTASAKK